MTDLDDRIRKARLELDAAVRTEAPDAGAVVRTRRSRRMRSIALCATVAVAAVAIGLRLSDDNGPSSVVTNGSASSTNTDLLAPGAAEVLPPSPLVGRFDPMAVWDGHDMLIWGGAEGAAAGARPLGDGASYNPRTKTWAMLPAAPLAARSDAAVVWTGEEMVIWGGSDNGRALSDGAAYNPATRHWRALPDAPIDGVIRPATVWTGEEMLVVGGLNAGAAGAAYNPTTDRWRPIADAPNGVAPPYPKAVWAGDRAVFRLTGAHKSLFSYEPSTNRWTALPQPDIDVSSIGWFDGTLLATQFPIGVPARLLRPGSSRWETATSTAPASNTALMQPVATPSEQIFWSPTSAMLLDGQTGQWRTDHFDLPVRPHGEGAAVWADGVLLVWGGFANHADGTAYGLDDGAIYRPSAAQTPVPARSSSTTVAANPERGDAATWVTDPAVPPSPDDTTFTALVTRSSCNSGVTGKVLHPEVVFTQNDVTVTINVEHDGDGGRCQGNRPVPVNVDLGQALGTRTLRDGYCNSPQATDGGCANHGIRWTPDTADGTADTGTLLLRSPDWASSVHSGNPSSAAGAAYSVENPQGQILERGAIGTHGEAGIVEPAGTIVISVPTLPDGTPCGFRQTVRIEPADHTIVPLECR